MSEGPKAPEETAEVTLATPVSLPEADRKSRADTEAEALRAIGQREINLIWEQTQMKVALSVVWTALVVAGVLAVMGKWLGTVDIQLAAIVFLFGVANLVTGFYFGRTNHQRTGGVGGDSAGAR